MRKYGLVIWSTLLSCGVIAGQVPFSPAAEKLASAILDGKVVGDSLACHAAEEKPFFDFSFRFEIGYVVTCPYRDFNGEANRVAVVARVRPAGGQPVILGDVYGVPALPEDLRGKANMKRFSGDLELSGAIGVGEGEYEVELLVADEHQRFYLKKWKTHVERRGTEKQAEVSLRANEVSPLVLPNVHDRRPGNDEQMRVTVLLDAAPIYPFSRRLRAWDRAFLLGSVSSLMRQMPDASVRLVAFNTDQQKELFRVDSLDRRGLMKLGDELRQVELGTISYRTLAAADGWAELLNRLVGEESMAENRSDAIVFLGPRIRTNQKIPRELLTCSSSAGPPLFYLQYFAFYGNEFPDAIDYLTKECKGRVLSFHSPGELGAAIQKMRESLAK